MQQKLFNEDIWDALRDCVAALGGNKAVGALLKPEIPATDAGKWLSNCLSESRPEKLCVEQILWLLRESQKVGCHAGMAFIAADACYTMPTPVEPEDEMAALQREFIEANKQQAARSARLEKLLAGMQVRKR